MAKHERDNGKMSITLIFKNKERLPLGNEGRGRFVESEKGRRAIFVPSFGVLEKEEVDYLVEGAQEQEDDRIKRKQKSEQKEALENVAMAMRQAPQGKRGKTGKEIIKEVSNGSK